MWSAKALKRNTPVLGSVLFMAARAARVLAIHVGVDVAEVRARARGGRGTVHARGAELARNHTPGIS